MVDSDFRFWTTSTATSSDNTRAISHSAGWATDSNVGPVLNFDGNGKAQIGRPALLKDIPY